MPHISATRFTVAYSPGAVSVSSEAGCAVEPLSSVNVDAAVAVVVVVAAA